MGNPTGFKEFAREPVPYRNALVRLEDFNEIFGEPFQFPANWICISQWPVVVKQFVKVMPTDYKRVLLEQSRRELQIQLAGN